MNDRVKRTACCDIFHGEDSIVLKLEMPGVSKDELDVRIDNQKLVISGKKEPDSSEGKYLVREIKAGNYYQEFIIDDTIDTGSVDASIKNGVVTLILNLKESVKPRKIQINAG